MLLTELLLESGCEFGIETVQSIGLRGSDWSLDLLLVAVALHLETERLLTTISHTIRIVSINY